MIRQAINDEASKHTFPEEYDYRAGIRYGGAVAEKVLRSEEAVGAMAAALARHEYRPGWSTCGCGKALGRTPFIEHQARVVLTLLAGGDHA